MAALITGASSGIGLELARIFAENGHDVVLVARSEGKLQTLASELQSRGRVRTHVIASDLSVPGAADGRLLRDQSVRALVQRGDRERAGRNGCDGDRSVSRPDRLRLSGRREAGGIEARRGQNAPVLARGRAGRIRRVDARHARV